MFPGKKRGETASMETGAENDIIEGELAGFGIEGEDPVAETDDSADDMSALDEVDG